MKKSFVIAGNWKMNPLGLDEAVALFGHYKRLAKRYNTQTFVSCVPALYIPTLSKLNKQNTVTLGGQNIYVEDKGSYTGAVSVPMVQNAGATTVLIGHSERRNLFGVDDGVVTKKIEKAIEHDMPMIVCFGEDDRDESGNYIEQLEKQIKAITDPFVKGRKTKLLTLAYEPVWAIGARAKRPVTVDELFSTMILIRNIVTKHLGAGRVKQITILYGGSVNGENAGELSTVPGVGGFLIGRASLTPDSLESICKAVSHT